MTELQDLEIDVSRSDLDNAHSEPWKHQTARHLAYLVLGAFVLTVQLLLVSGLIMLAYRGAADGESFVSKVLAPYFQAVSSFVAAVFGTPLGFVLGYYFSKDKDSDRSGGRPKD
jgi:hypothetical protein